MMMMMMMMVMMMMMMMMMMVIMWKQASLGAKHLHLQPRLLQPPRLLGGGNKYYLSRIQFVATNIIFPKSNKLASLPPAKFWQQMFPFPPLKFVQQISSFRTNIQSYLSHP